MRDCFALLGQPRRAWLDPEELKAAFHTRTRSAHPDARPGAGEVSFTEVHAAYRVLADPRQRLQHLLELAGEEPGKGGRAIPPEIAALFDEVASITHAAEKAVRKMERATSPLSRSLVQSELAQARSGVAEMLATLAGLYARAEDELRALDDAGETRNARLHELHARFAYLTRWIAQLAERRTQLSLL